MKPNSIIIEYLAGFIDADGCLGKEIKLLKRGKIA